MAYGRTRLATVLCLLITGCGSFHVPSGTASSSRASSSPAASAARVASGARVASPCPGTQVPGSFPTSPAANRNLVIAKLRGSDQTVIRDVSEIDHASTIATVDLPGGWAGDAWTSPSFGSQSAISYVADSRRLMRLALPGLGTVLLAETCFPQSIVTFGWSPDGQSFTYLIDPEDSTNPPNAFQWHLVSAGVDRVIGTAPLWCYCGNGSEDFTLAVRFSPDGQFVSLVDYVWRGTNLQVRRLDGSLVGSEIRGDQSYPNPPTMGVWSGADLFFRDQLGVERWTNGVIKPFLPGVTWLHPWASPSGGQIVYSVRGSDGVAHVSVVDTTSGRTRQLSSQPRTAPVYLSSRYVWYRGERPCAPNDPGICIKTTYTGTTYIYDLQTGTESQSILTDVADVWPHGA
jgi:hypothetical protein